MKKKHSSSIRKRDKVPVFTMTVSLDVFLGSSSSSRMKTHSCSVSFIEQSERFLLSIMALASHCRVVWPKGVRVMRVHLLCLANVTKTVNSITLPSADRGATGLPPHKHEEVKDESESSAQFPSPCLHRMFTLAGTTGVVVLVRQINNIYTQAANRSPQIPSCQSK